MLVHTRVAATEQPNVLVFGLVADTSIKVPAKALLTIVDTDHWIISSYELSLCHYQAKRM
jgi:hypothetical protein